MVNKKEYNKGYEDGKKEGYDKGYKEGEDTTQEGCAALIGLFIGLFIMGCFCFILSVTCDNRETQQLGTAICDQQHGLEFDSYQNRELKCKQPIEETSYDGITIQIPKENK